MTRLSPERLAQEEAEAADYAAAIRDGERHDWPAINAAIERRFSLSALRRIKERAWKMLEPKPSDYDDD